jgi:excisionase family DNA binding protein
MLTLDQVEEVLNLGKPLVYALVQSGELRAAQFGGRGYLALLSRLTRIVPAIEGEERLMQPRILRGS